MTYLATTTVAVLRGETVDAYGDAVAGSVAVAEGVPASLLERSRVTNDPATGEARTVTYSVARLKAGTDVVESDRIRDERAGVTYSVLSIRTRGSIVGHADLELELVKARQDR